MANVEYRVDVVVDPKLAQTGAKKAEDALGKVQDKADAIGPAIRRAFGAIGAALSVREILRQADAYQQLQNRLRVVVGDTGALRDVTEKLFQIAQNTRSSFEGTVELYARLANSAKELGVKQSDLLLFTERVNKAIILSGASATEAQAGLIQLSQGLASGALRGDELRSVLEQLPAVADVIAKSLGVTRGELRQLGGEGKITAQVVLDAFVKAGQGLDESFAKTVPTLGQAFTVLGNSVLSFIGQVDQAAGVTGAISRAVIFASQNVDILAAAVIGLSTAILASLVAKAFPALIAQLAVLKTIALTNPFVLIAAGITAATVALISLTAETEKYNAVQKQISGEGEGSALTAYGKLGERVMFAEKQLRTLNATLANQQKTGASAGVLATTQGQIQMVTEKLAVLRGESVKMTDQFNKQATATTKASASFNELIKGLNEEAAALKLATKEREVRERLLQAEKALEKQGTQLTPTLKLELEAKIRANQALQDQAKALEDIRGPQEDYMRRLEALQVLLDAGTISQEEFNAAAEKAKPSILTPDVPTPTPGPAGPSGIDPNTGAPAGAVFGPEVPAALGEQLAQLEQIKGPMIEYQNTLANIDALYRQGAISAEEAQVAVDRLVLSGASGSTTLEDGFARAFARIREEARDTASAVEAGMGALVNRTTDALVELAETGKISFSDLARAIIQDLIRIIARLLIVQALAAATGLGGGAAVVNTAANVGAQQLEQRASGGPVQPQRSYVVGEEGPEILRMGSQGGFIEPNGASAPAAPAAPPVVNVINVTDPNEIDSALNSGRYDKAVLNVIARNPAQAKKLMGG